MLTDGGDMKGPSRGLGMSKRMTSRGQPVLGGNAGSVGLEKLQRTQSQEFREPAEPGDAGSLHPSLRIRSIVLITESHELKPVCAW